MGSIFEQLKNIIKAEALEAADKLQDPAKQTKRIMYDLERQLDKVTNDTAALDSKKKTAYRDLERCKAEIKELEVYTEKALRAGNEDHANQFAEKQVELMADLETYQSIYDQLVADTAEMKAKRNELVKNMKDCQRRQATVAAKVTVARTQEAMSKTGASINKANGYVGEFARMERKAEEIMDKSNAILEIDAEDADSTASLKKLYGPTTSASDLVAAAKTRIAENA